MIDTIPKDIRQFVKVRRLDDSEELLLFLYQFHIQNYDHDFRAVRCLLYHSNANDEAIDSILLFFNTREEIKNLEYDITGKRLDIDFSIPFAEQLIISDISASINSTSTQKIEDNLPF